MSDQPERPEPYSLDKPPTSCTWRAACQGHPRFHMHKQHPQGALDDQYVCSEHLNAALGQGYRKRNGGNPNAGSYTPGLVRIVHEDGTVDESEPTLRIGRPGRRPAPPSTDDEPTVRLPEARPERGEDDTMPLGRGRLRWPHRRPN
jgi:hypothetical protein